jgi:DtxR family Mn-dependent transcriptional regulator
MFFAHRRLPMGKKKYCLFALCASSAAGGEIGQSKFAFAIEPISQRKQTMAKREKLSSNMEDYLEAIFHISSEKRAARAKDIAERLKVNKSSVTGALRSLSEKGYVNYAPYDIITLTATGHELAKDVVRRHETLKDFFVKILLLDDQEAEEASCKVEHAISEKILDRIINFVEFMEICPRGGKEWLKGFRRHCESGDTTVKCTGFISACLADLKKREQHIRNGSTEPVLLKEMDPGQRGKITEIKGRSAINKQLADMGVSSGSIIEVESLESYDNRVDVKVRGYHLSLSREDAGKISVELQL